MGEHLSPDHRKCNLFFLFEGGVTDQAEAAFEEFLVSATTQRDWTIEAPGLIDYLDEFPDRPEPEQFVRTYGGVLQIYSALPPWGDRLPKEIDCQHFHEVAWLVARLSEFSQSFKCEFRLQLDDTHVGFVGDGKPDRSVQQGLLDEWKRVLGI